MSALIYPASNKWRFALALTAAALIHLAAVSLATAHRQEPEAASGFSGEPTIIEIEPADPGIDPPPDPTESMPPPPAIDELYVETATPPPVRRQTIPSVPLVRPRNNRPAGSLNLSSAKIFALNAPRPEYPYEARRHKISGDGVVVMTVDPVTGSVSNVALTKSTGNVFLDNAAVAGFKRWRFRPGTVSLVTCPVAFTLTGVSY